MVEQLRTLITLMMICGVAVLVGMIMLIAEKIQHSRRRKKSNEVVFSQYAQMVALLKPFMDSVDVPENTPVVALDELIEAYRAAVVWGVELKESDHGITNPSPQPSGGVMEEAIDCTGEGVRNEPVYAVAVIDRIRIGVPSPQ